jgi:hypothetical protein
MAQKHIAFAPLCQKQLGSRLRSPYLFKRLLLRYAPRNARSASLTVFSPYSLRLARESDGAGRRVCLSRALRGAKKIPSLCSEQASQSHIIK